RPGMSGYFTVASSLKDVFDTQGPLSWQQLVDLTAADCARIFGQDADAAYPRDAADPAHAANPRSVADPAHAANPRSVADPAHAANPRSVADPGDAANLGSAADRGAPAERADAATTESRGATAGADFSAGPAGAESRAAVAELMGLFARALNDLGRFAGER